MKTHRFDNKPASAQRDGHPCEALNDVKHLTSMESRHRRKPSRQSRRLHLEISPWTSGKQLPRWSNMTWRYWTVTVLTWSYAYAMREFIRNGRRAFSWATQTSIAGTPPTPQSGNRKSFLYDIPLRQRGPPTAFASHEHFEKFWMDPGVIFEACSAAGLYIRALGEENPPQRAMLDKAKPKATKTFKRKTPTRVFLYVYCLTWCFWLRRVLQNPASMTRNALFVFASGRTRLNDSCQNAFAVVQGS